MDYIKALLATELVIFISTFIISVLLFYVAKIILKKMQFGQIVRDDGPETHLKKKGTPTMAGIVFVIVLIITMCIYSHKVILFSIVFGLIGFVDDFTKVMKKNTKGLKSIWKFIAQIVVAVIAILYPFNAVVKINIIMILILVFIIVGTDNGVNFTDGLDGLCTMVTIAVCISYIFVSYKRDSLELISVNVIVLAMLFAFLIYNHFPAKLFMGDTGSLLLGAYVALMAIELNVHFYLPIFGFIYMIEVLSVILQVSYFKMTHGKRIFKMAPIHHHFEKCGFSEVKVVMLFTLVTIIGAVITYVFL